MNTFLLLLTSPLTKMLGVCAFVGIACGLLWFFSPAWLPINHTHLLWAAVVCLSVAIFSTYWFHAGERHMAQLIAAKDAAAVAKVKDALGQVDACIARGGNWDVTIGSCDR